MTDRPTGPPRPRPRPKPRPGSVVFEPLLMPEEQERMIEWYKGELAQLLFCLAWRGVNFPPNPDPLGPEEKRR